MPASCAGLLRSLLACAILRVQTRPPLCTRRSNHVLARVLPRRRTAAGCAGPGRAARAPAGRGAAVAREDAGGDLERAAPTARPVLDDGARAGGDYLSRALGG